MENPFPIARMKDFVEIDVSTRRKILPLTVNCTNGFKMTVNKK